MGVLRLQFNGLGFEVYDDSRLMTLYRAKEELPRVEAPKPCFAPIYTPSGGLVTEYRPTDHTWHTGLYFGWVRVNDANLWGGPWYLPEKGKYEYVEGSHGMQRHEAFTEARTAAEEVAVTETLTWLDEKDRPMAEETRRYRIQALKDTPGYQWFIDVAITPVVDALSMGASKAARYSGLVLRMGPPFADADHRSSEGLAGHEQIMGARARWVSAAGAAGGAVIMMDHPENPRHPTPWFTRKNLLGAALLMDTPLEIRRPDHLRLRYGLAVLDDAPDAGAAEAMYAGYVKQA